ncbi:hypothetical protein ACMA5I_06605 [Paracoccaceae bacterium GXU_MW_L88]
MAFRMMGIEKIAAANETLLTGFLGCYDTLGDPDYEYDRDFTLHERSAYELVREQLTDDQRAELDKVDAHWRDHAKAFNEDFAIEHNQEDRETALYGFVRDEEGRTPAIPRGHWWWRPIEDDA